MRPWQIVFIIVSAVLPALFIAPARGAEAILNDVPAYDWTHGCSPTAGTMLMGYWDVYGYSNLIPGSNLWASNQSGVQDAIASPCHVADYALYDGVEDTQGDIYPDMSDINPSGAHPDDSMADFMGTSRSASGLCYGATFTVDIGDGVEDYASWRGCDFAAGGGWIFVVTWDDFTHEIDFGRPAILGVDVTGDGYVDHSVTTIGYRDTNGYQEYACRDTWSTSTTPRWERFRPISSSYSWGVAGWDTFRPSAATVKDTAFTGGSGAWHIRTLWSKRVPRSNSYAYIPAGASVTISTPAEAGYLLNAGALEIQSGSLTAEAICTTGSITQADGAVGVSKGLAVGKGGTYALTGGQVTAAESITICDSGEFEWIGGDLQTPLLIIKGTGAVFDAHCDFTIGPAGQIGLIEAEDGGSLVIGNGITATQTVAMDSIRSISVACDAGSTGTYEMVGSASLQDCDVTVAAGGQGCFNISNSARLTSGSFRIGMGGTGSGVVCQSGGTNSVAFLKVGAVGRYELSGAGLLNCNLLYVGSEDPGDGIFAQTGGFNVVSDALYLGGQPGSGGVYTISAGSLTAADMYVGDGGGGTFDIAGATADITISNRLKFGAAGALSAGTGAAIHMTRAAFENQSTNAANLAGLGNLKMIFEGGTGDADPFEVAGEDIGAVMGGFVESNFVLGALQLGGIDAGLIRLVDDFDNQDDGSLGNEALYVETLTINSGSCVDLDGLNLYFKKDGNAKKLYQGDADVDGQVADSDLSLLLSNWNQSGGWPEGDFDCNGAVTDADLSLLLSNWQAGVGGPASAVPEPTALTLFALGALAVLKRRPTCFPFQRYRKSGEKST